MDEPSQVAGGSHRDFRHDLASLPTAIQLFSKLYGADVVENIFLDHLKADSEEIRKHEHEADYRSSKLWSKEEDNYIYNNFLQMSDEVLETNLQNKSKSEIRQRRECLGLIRPKFVRRTKNRPRIQKLVFRLQRGQKISGNVKVIGGNNDIDFGSFYYQGSVATLMPKNPERISNLKSFNFQIDTSGNYCFYFSNSFSLVTSKDVEFTYRLENGKSVRISFRI